MSIQEFILPRRFTTDRRSSLRWLSSHSRQNWYLILAAVLASFGNAVLMSVTPILIGQAYNLITAPVIDLVKLGQIAAVIAITQVVRSGSAICPQRRVRADCPTHRAQRPRGAVYKPAGQEHDLSQPAAAGGYHGAGHQ